MVEIYPLYREVLSWSYSFKLAENYKQGFLGLLGRLRTFSGMGLHKMANIFETHSFPGIERGYKVQ